MCPARTRPARAYPRRGPKFMLEVSCGRLRRVHLHIRPAAGAAIPASQLPWRSFDVQFRQIEGMVSCVLTEEELGLVSAASSLVPVLSANAEQADAMGRLPGEDITALREAALFRLAAPGHTGAMRPARARPRPSAELGRGCSSASWVVVVYYSASVALWLFPDEVRHLVWGRDPDAAVCGSSAGAVPVRAAEGGYLLSGRWGWASGAHHASWAVHDHIVGKLADGRPLASAASLHERFALVTGHARPMALDVTSVVDLKGPPCPRCPPSTGLDGPRAAFKDGILLITPEEASTRERRQRAEIVVMPTSA
jgi:hypothetical protein